MIRRICEADTPRRIGDSDKQRPSTFLKIMFKQTDSGIQQLHSAAKRTQDQQSWRRLLIDRPNTNTAKGILGAAEYIASSSDASVGTATGTRYCGRMIAAMEKPLATRTSIAVTSEASRIAFISVIRFLSLSKRVRA
jgi:hypothetical protein